MSFLPFYDRLEKFMDNLKDKSGTRTSPWPLFVVGFALLVLAYLIMTAQVGLAVELALFLAPLWLPAIIVLAAWGLWMDLSRSRFIAKQKVILLEIKPPRNLMKTPLAMEAVLSGLHLSGGDGTWYEKYFTGKLRPWLSFEIVSLEGQVHFFLWTRAGLRKLIEAQFYAQYPGVQITEAPDYTQLISAKPEEWALWGCDFVHTNSKVSVPLKTYVEYGLDKTQKEPEQVDPLAHLVEFMGTLGKGEYMWIQYVVRAHKGESFKGKKNAEGKQYTWKDEAKEVVEKIIKEARIKDKDEQGKERLSPPILTGARGDLIAAIERNIAKLAFDVGARGIYLARPEKFDPVNITGLTGGFKQFSSESPWNGIRPARWMTDFNNYPWEIGVEKLQDKARRGIVEAYRRRQYYYPPFVAGSHMVLSTEEFATLYHIPSAAIEAPSLPRIQSATSEAPVNLPV